MSIILEKKTEKWLPFLILTLQIVIQIKFQLRQKFLTLTTEI